MFQVGPSNSQSSLLEGSIRLPVELFCLKANVFTSLLAKQVKSNLETAITSSEKLAKTQMKFGPLQSEVQTAFANFTKLSTYAANEAPSSQQFETELTAHLSTKFNAQLRTDLVDAQVYWLLCTAANAELSGSI